VADVAAGWRDAVPPSGPPSAPPSAPAAPPADLAADLIGELVGGLVSGVVVVDRARRVVLANRAARAMGVVSAGRVAVPRLGWLADATRRDGASRDYQLDLPVRPKPPLRRPRPDQEATTVRVRTRTLGADGHVALILDDVTAAKRVEEVRRDFVANVSHELKTPVGALQLLAEALAAASDDPQAVRRFSERMAHEASRLGRLVQEIIDLSRLQGAGPLPARASAPVRTGAVVAEAIDRTRLAAAARHIVVAVVGEEARVAGDTDQLVTALANLLENAITYSPEGTRVVVGVRTVEDMVEISVADEGIGIAEKDLRRVFERFYRADPARSRATGGTGLGLAIVKHIVSNHRGSVAVWSAEGAGSTFTLRLPAHVSGTGGNER
jgi:two-component system sensor histidine kinase SenX3